MNAICGDCSANSAIRFCFVDTFVEFRGIRRVSQKRFHDSTSRFPPLAPAGGCSPTSAVLSRRYDFLPPIPPHFVAFAWRYLSVHSLCSLPGGRVRRQGLELVTRYLQPGIRRGANRVLPSSWGTPSVRLSMFFDSGRTACTRPIWSSSMALGMTKTKAPTTGLSELNSMAFGLAVYASPSSLPCPTQDSLPAAGQALPDGLSTRKVPMKGFRSCRLHLIPLSQALLGAMFTPAVG